MGSSPKTSPEFQRFNALVGKVLSLPPDEAKRRIEQDHETYKPKKQKKSKLKTTQTPPH
jgi:hypothetical protein